MTKSQYLQLLKYCDIPATCGLKFNKPLAYEITTKYCRSCPAYINCKNNDCFYYSAYSLIKNKS